MLFDGIKNLTINVTCENQNKDDSYLLKIIDSGIQNITSNNETIMPNDGYNYSLFSNYSNESMCYYNETSGFGSKDSNNTENGLSNQKNINQTNITQAVSAIDSLLKNQIKSEYLYEERIYRIPVVRKQFTICAFNRVLDLTV